MIGVADKSFENALSQRPSSSTLQQSHEGEHHGDYGSIQLKLTRSAYIFAFCGALFQFNCGYDIGVSTDVGKMVQDDLGLSQLQREFFVGSIHFWSVFGAIGAQYLSDRFGRRSTICIAAVVFIFGVFIMASAQSFEVLMFGRVFVGLGVGTGLPIGPLYIAEVTPAKFRGELVTWTSISLNSGMVFGFSMGLFFARAPDALQWRAMYLFGTLMPMALILLIVKVMPESPRWLVSKGLYWEAVSVLQQIYPEGYDVDPVISDIKEAWERDMAAEGAEGWSVIFSPTPAIQRMLLVGVGTAMAQQAVGIDAIQYYLVDVLRESGVESHRDQTLIIIALGCIKLYFISIAGKMFDVQGRRPLLFASLLGAGASLLLVSLFFFVSAELNITLMVLGLALYLAFYSIGIGPGAWLIASEVFASSIRAKAMSLASISNRIAAFVTSSTSLTLVASLGWGGFFLLLSAMCVLLFLFIHFYLPETRGRSLEEMSVYFAEVTGDNVILEAEAKLRARQVEMTQYSKTHPSIESRLT